MQYEKSGIFAFMGRRNELCIRNINTLTRQNDYSNEKVPLQSGPASFCGTETHVRIGVQKSLEAFQRQDGVRRPVRRFRTALAHHQAGKTRRNRNLQ